MNSFPICLYYLNWHTHRARELLPMSESIPSCQPRRHRVKSLGWLVLVIRPVSHYTHTQGARFNSAQRRNLSILFSRDARRDFNVFATAIKFLWTFLMLLDIKKLKWLDHYGLRHIKSYVYEVFVSLVTPDKNIYCLNEQIISLLLGTKNQGAWVL